MKTRVFNEQSTWLSFNFHYPQFVVLSVRKRKLKKKASILAIVYLCYVMNKSPNWEVTNISHNIQLWLSHLMSSIGVVNNLFSIV